MDCHGDAEPEGNLSLHDLGPVDEVNAATWKSVWAQVTLKEMPPKDADQPKVVQRLQFSDWIVGELTRVMRDKGGFRAHLDPNKANFVDHDSALRFAARWHQTRSNIIAGAHLARHAARTHHAAERIDQYGTGV